MKPWRKLGRVAKWLLVAELVGWVIGMLIGAFYIWG